MSIRCRAAKSLMRLCQWADLEKLLMTCALPSPSPSLPPPFTHARADFTRHAVGHIECVSARPAVAGCPWFKSINSISSLVITPGLHYTTPMKADRTWKITNVTKSRPRRHSGPSTRDVVARNHEMGILIGISWRQFLHFPEALLFCPHVV